MVPGEWWRLRVLDSRANESIQGTLVVTAVDSGGISFGLGADSVHPMMLNYHATPPGRTGADLSYDVHGRTFQPLQFPLHEGQTWQTHFGGAPITAQVKDADGTRAHIQYLVSGERLYGEAVYDADVGWFVDFRMGRQEIGSKPGADYWIQSNVIDHGFAYGCQSLQPDNVHLIDFDYGPRYPVPLDVRPFTVDPDATHMAISMSVGSAHGSSGTARQQIIGPDGTSLYQVEASPGENYRHLFVVNTQPAGPWHTVTGLAAGGYAATTISMFAAKDVPAFGPPAPGTDSCIPLEPQSAGVESVSHDRDWEAGPWRFLVLAGALAARFWRRAFWAGIGLFTRLDGQAPHDQPVRKRMLELLDDQPGLSTQEIRKTLAIGWGTTIHHLSVLERQGWLVRAHSGRRVFWTVPGKAVAPRQFGTAAELLQAIKQNPGVGPSQLASLLGIRHSTAIYHAHRLQHRGLVRVESEGRRRKYYAA